MKLYVNTTDQKRNARVYSGSLQIVSKLLILLLHLKELGTKRKHLEMFRCQLRKLTTWETDVAQTVQNFPTRLHWDVLEHLPNSHGIIFKCLIHQNND